MTSSGHGGSSGSPDASSTYAAALARHCLWSHGEGFHDSPELASATYFFIIRYRRKLSSLITRIFKGSGRWNVSWEPTGANLRPGFPVDVQVYLAILRRNTNRTEIFIELWVLLCAATARYMVHWSSGRLTCVGQCSCLGGQCESWWLLAVSDPLGPTRLAFRRLYGLLRTYNDFWRLAGWVH